MYNLSSAEGKKWADICTEITERVRRMGPNPVRNRDGVAKAAVLEESASVAESEQEAPSRCC
jgi:hypothetical protein